MSTKEKLLRRFQNCPKDFTVEELDTMMGYLGYCREEKGKTSGSRIAFVSDASPPILLHRPHPGNTLKQYQIRQVLELLEKEGLL